MIRADPVTASVSNRKQKVDEPKIHQSSNLKHCIKIFLHQSHILYPFYEAN